MAAGSIAGGGVSIAVRLKKYSGNQACVLSCDIL
jgi:hypothetical protein